MRVLRELEEMGGNEQQLKKKAYEVIEKLNPEAAKTFISFERMKVFTSKEKRERFDRGNIIKSLLRETKVSRAVAEKIGGEVEGRVKDMKIEYLNTPLIREMVSSKLLEYGHEPVHRDYSRIGMPVFEVRKRLDAGNFENPEILREYTWLSAITGKARELHFDSLIHIFHPEDFCTKIHCAPVHFSGEPEDMAIAAKKADALCSLPVTAGAWNFSLASTGVAGKKITAKAQAADKIFSLTKGKRMAELALFADFEWKAEAGFKKKAVHAAVAMQQSPPRSFSTYVSVDSKYQLKLLGKKFIPGLTIVNNSRERALLYPGAIAIGASGGILQLVGINLEKIAQLSGEERGFFSLLDETAKAIAELCNQKRQEIAKRPYMDKALAAQSSPAVCLS
ncbi:MAG: hypothetical protein Q8Q97_00005, partial [bacterium]|nr:hypothetical protein [bacterium]